MNNFVNIKFVDIILNLLTLNLLTSACSIADIKLVDIDAQPVDIKHGGVPWPIALHFDAFDIHFVKLPINL